MAYDNLRVDRVFSAIWSVPGVVRGIQFPQIRKGCVHFYDHLLCGILFETHSVFINHKKGGVTHGRDGNYESGCQQR